MLRARLNDALKEAMKNRDEVKVNTVRLILAALKDRDIAARGKGKLTEIGEDEILSMLQSMIKQRNESIKLYEQGNRKELADQERAEIEVIQSFLPEPLSEEEMAEAIQRTIGEVGASSIKEMGKVMAVLKENYAGRMDFAKASAVIKERLG
ncbi:MAG: GatB/YqeY domain-containing protein [Rhodospirillales bacterium]